MRKISKKQTILNLFEKNKQLIGDEHWKKYGTVYISQKDLYGAGLDQTIEYADKYSDVIYALKVLREAGYKVTVLIWSICVTDKEINAKYEASTRVKK